MTKISLCIIGGGNMGAALARGLVAGSLPIKELAIVELNADRRTQLERDFVGAQILAQIPKCSAVVVAVKPNQVDAVCRELANAGVTQVLSIAAGVTIVSLENACGQGIGIIRAMPNTPALIGQGAAAISASSGCSRDQIEWARQILLNVGTVVEVEESLLDLVTGLSGSGPAYIFLLAEALISAGIQLGLSPTVADQLVRQLLVGSSALLSHSKLSPAELRKNVTSPNGTTEAGIAELLNSRFTEIVSAAVHAATERSKQLGS